MGTAQALAVYSSFLQRHCRRLSLQGDPCFLGLKGSAKGYAKGYLRGGGLGVRAFVRSSVS